MAKWSATRRARFNYRKYEKPGRFTDKQRAAYWKKKYLACARASSKLHSEMKDW